MHNLLDQATQRFFDQISGARLWLDWEREPRFTLWLYALRSLPPNWLKGLSVELIHDTLPIAASFSPEISESDGSPCALLLKPRTGRIPAEFLAAGACVPVRQVVLRYGNATRSFPNQSSLAAFRARPCLDSDAEI